MKLKDLSNATIEEMDAMSISTRLDGNGDTIYSDDAYYDKDGVRYFRKPLKVRICNFLYDIPGRRCLVKVFDNEYDAYVFALSLDKSKNKVISQLARVIGKGKGYSSLAGMSDEEAI